MVRVMHFLLKSSVPTEDHRQRALGAEVEGVPGKMLALQE